MNEQISQAVIRRLPRYYRYLGDLLMQGTERISSNELSVKMNSTASQIRQDLNNFGGFGQQGYGYNVKYLHEEIGKILGLDKVHNMIIVGAGNLAKAIVRYDKFERLGFPTLAMFDVNPDLFGTTINGIKVYSLDDLESFVKENRVDIAALTLPKQNAVDAANKLVSLGVKSIWNFAHVDLEFEDEDVVVENVHLSDSLMQLSYNITRK
ncbi:MAG: redox-sensing transcriptional repressor Rex [Lachnospiraceae bacterium]|nr:redox-sensing transcriptional repressor Rex [Lachnospiraceae bacterium]